MASLSSLEKKQLEDLFGMSSGYVMNFSNSSFYDFFKTELGIDIYDNKYDFSSGSKANRLRAFWDNEPDIIVGKALEEMLNVWEYENDNTQGNKAFWACRKTVSRLLGDKKSQEMNEEEFLEKDFGSISIAKLPCDSSLFPILEARLKEAYQCLKSRAPLATIFLCGSVLEGALLGAAQENPRKFNQANAAPKDTTGKVRCFQDWTLGNFIDVACEVGILKLDVKRFSHELRDFRNYIHPYMQMVSKFNPDSHTAQICLQVLKAAIADLSKER